MLSFMISLLFAGTLVGSLIAIAAMLSANGSRILAALAGDDGLALPITGATAEPIALPRHATIRADRFRPAVRAAQPGLSVAA